MSHCFNITEIPETTTAPAEVITLMEQLNDSPVTLKFFTNRTARKKVKTTEQEAKVLR